MFKKIILFSCKFILFSAILFILWLPFYSAYLSLVYDLSEIFFGFTYYSKFASSISVAEDSGTSEILTPLIPFIAMVLAVNKINLSRTRSAAVLVLLALSIFSLYLNLSYVWWILALLSLLLLVYRRGWNKNYLVFLAAGCIIILLMQIFSTEVYIESVTLEALFPAMKSQGYDVSKIYIDYRNSESMLGILRPLEVIMPFILGVAFMFMYSDILPKFKDTGDSDVKKQEKS